MRKHTTILTLGVIGILVAAMVYGCSSDSSTSPGDDKTPQPAPNLAVVSVSAPASAEHQQDIAGVSVDIANTGDADADTFTVRISIAYDDKGNDAVVLYETDTLLISANDTITVSTGALTVPLEVTVGAARLLVEVDPEGRVGEKSEDDNLSARAIQVDAVTGYVYRWAGVVRGNFGVPGDGPEGQRPHLTNLYWPQDVGFDPTGNVYVADWNNHRILNLDDDGNFYELIGGRFGDAQDGVAREIGLNHPTDVTFDPQGNLILTAWHNSLIKRMNPNTGMIYTMCGIDNVVDNRKYNGDGIPAEEAFLDLPVTSIFDSEGNMFFGDQGSMVVRKIDTQGIIHTVAGTPPESLLVGGNMTYVRHRGFSGDGGPAVDAELSFEFGQGANPSGRICFDSQENIYIADTSNNCVRVVNKATGIISRYAGVGPNAWIYNAAHEGAPATTATLFRPRDVVCDENDNLYIADTGHECIRMVDGDGNIWTVAGIPGVPGPPTAARGVPALEARFAAPYGVEIGPNGNLWIADQENNLIRILYL